MTKKELAKLNKERRDLYAAMGYELVPETTKKADMIRAAFDRNEGDLYSAYGRFSHAKLNVWRAWLDKAAADFESWGVHIASHNTTIFTLAFEFCDPITDEVMRAYITPAHNYVTSAI